MNHITPGELLRRQQEAALSSVREGILASTEAAHFAGLTVTGLELLAKLQTLAADGAHETGRPELQTYTRIGAQGPYEVPYRTITPVIFPDGLVVMVQRYHKSGDIDLTIGKRTQSADGELFVGFVAEAVFSSNVLTRKLTFQLIGTQSNEPQTSPADLSVLLPNTFAINDLSTVIAPEI